MSKNKNETIEVALANGNDKAPVKDKAPVYEKDKAPVYEKDKAPVDEKDKAPIDEKDKAQVEEKAPVKDKAAVIQAVKDKADEIRKELQGLVAPTVGLSAGEAADLQNELDSLRNMVGEITKNVSGSASEYNYIKNRYLELENTRLKNILVKILLEDNNI